MNTTKASRAVDKITIVLEIPCVPSLEPAMSNQLPEGCQLTSYKPGENDSISIIEIERAKDAPDATDTIVWAVLEVFEDLPQIQTVTTRYANPNA